jgi:hypothetical protein
MPMYMTLRTDKKKKMRILGTVWRRGDRAPPVGCVETNAQVGSGIDLGVIAMVQCTDPWLSQKAGSGAASEHGFDVELHR